MPTIIPITSHHCHEPLTQSDKNFLIGLLIAIHLIWLTTMLIQLVKYLKQDGWKSKCGWDYWHYYIDDNFFIGCWHFLMSTIFIIEFICLLAYFISLML